MRQRLSANIEEDGISIVPHDLINGFVQRTKAEEILLVSGGQELELAAEGATAQIPEFNLNDWPELPVNDGRWSEWSNDVLDAVVGVLHAAAHPDAGQENLTGVEVSKSYAAATDARRLAVAELPEPLPQAAVVPAEAIRLIAAMPGQGCAVRMGATVAEFRKGEKTCIARLIQHAFPDWKSKIPNELPGHLTVDTQAFRTAVELALFFADPQRAEIELRPSTDLVGVAARGQAVVEDTIAADTNLDASILVNGRFLADALRPLINSTVRLGFTADRTRFVIRENRLTQMVMTVRN